jgi:hypothetical protein
LDAKGVVEPYQEPRESQGWLTLALGVVVFALFGAVVGYAWFNGLPGVGGEPPLIRADAAPYRHAPSERGGLEVANAKSSVVSVLRPQGEPPRVERLLPPEVPMAIEADEPDPMPPANAPDAATAGAAPEVAAPAPDSADTPATVTPPSDASEAAAPAEPEPPAAAADATAPAVPRPVAKPGQPPQLAAREPPATISALPRPLVPARTQTAPRAAPAPAPAAPAAQRTPRGDAPAQTAAMAPRAPAPPPRAAGPGAEIYRLQLTAVRTEAGLSQAWAQLRQRYPRALASASPNVERTETSSGPLFRLQAGPYGSREAAAIACSAIRGAGGQCFIVGPIAP